MSILVSFLGMSINSVTSRRPYICEISVSCRKSGMFDNCASVSKVGKPFDQNCILDGVFFTTRFLGRV